MRHDIDLDEFKRQLQTRLAELSDSKKPVAPVSLDQTRVGRLSRMDAMQQQAMAKAAERLAEQEQHRIRTALNRIRSGDYGYCMLCEEEIDEGRLRADASVLICITCARERERR